MPCACINDAPLEHLRPVPGFESYVSTSTLDISSCTKTKSVCSMPESFPWRISNLPPALSPMCYHLSGGYALVPLSPEPAILSPVQVFGEQALNPWNVFIHHLLGEPLKP